MHGWAGSKLVVQSRSLEAPRTDLGQTHDVIVIKNGTISDYLHGISMVSNRVSVIAVTATRNGTGIHVSGPQALVKSSTGNGNATGILVGDRGQVQQSTAVNNVFIGIWANGDNCLVTMNTVGDTGNSYNILTGNRCTVSYNTVNETGPHSSVGIAAGTANLVTRNTSVNTDRDFVVQCPSTVTFNTSTKGFPASYLLIGNGCQTVGND
jgi:hypothetical protein